MVFALLADSHKWCAGQSWCTPEHHDDTYFNRVKVGFHPEVSCLPSPLRFWRWRDSHLLRGRIRTNAAETVIHGWILGGHVIPWFTHDSHTRTLIGSDVEEPVSSSHPSTHRMIHHLLIPKTGQRFDGKALFLGKGTAEGTEPPDILVGWEQGKAISPEPDMPPSLVTQKRTFGLSSPMASPD